MIRLKVTRPGRRLIGKAQALRLVLRATVTSGGQRATESGEVVVVP